MTAAALDREMAGLFVASRIWAARRPVDEDRVRAARNQLLLGNHRRYVAEIPVYRRLATDLGLADSCDVEELVPGLLLGVELFKSYDDAWLAEGNFAALTDWVGDISALTPAPDLAGVDSLPVWRRSMRSDGIYLGMSSGTSGRPSFVPRDRATLAALAGNGRCYSPLLWGGYAEGTPDYDLLLLAPPGRAVGIESVATGLAGLAGDTHVLVPPEAGEPRGAVGELEERLGEATAFVRTVAAGGRRLLIFGSPPAVAWLCSLRLEGRCRLPLPPETLVVTGGGWKGAGEQDGAASPAVLGQLLSDALEVPPGRWVDVYGMAECNAFLLRCPAGRYHVPPVLEALVVDEDLRPRTDPVATGDIALLDPFAFCYPGFLLTGDRGRLVADACGCGLAGAGFEGVIQRAPAQPDKGCAGAPGPFRL